MASYDLADVAPSSDASSIVCGSNGNKTELSYVMMSSLIKLIKNRI